MRTTLTRLFTVALLMMISLGAKADVKVLYGEKGTELQPDKYGTITLAQKELTGGTIIISQEEQKDGTTKVTFAVTPDKNYKLAENGLEVYAVIPADISSTRGLEVSTTLTLKSEDFKDEALKRTYTTTIDSKLNLWLKSADFQKEGDNGRKAAITGEQDDYSGVYYIGSRDFAEANTTTNNNFYLCPTENWAYYQSDPPYYYVYSSGCNTDTPFMTTYQCRDGVSNDADGEPYDARKAIWIVEKEGNYYHIKHAVDGKYLTRNGKMGESSNAGRMRIHLESSPADDDDALFEIIWIDAKSSYDIKTKKNDGSSGDNALRQFLNIVGASGDTGNQPSLQATGVRSDGPSKMNVGGILGLWKAGSSGDSNSKWYLEEVVEQPVISQAANGDITITCSTSSTTIYYTLDGSDPVVPADGASDPTEPTYKYTTTFSPAVGSTGVKAVAVLSNLHAAASKKAERSFVAYSTPTFSFDGVNQVTISATHADATIYYTTNDDDPVVDPSLIYDGAPLTISSANTVKAIAAHTGFLTSDIATFAIAQVETPTIQNNGSNAISITSATPGATIYYTTDGSTPTTSSTEYIMPLTDNVSNVTIKAIAVKKNMLPSEVGSGSVKLKCAAPVITRIGMTFTLSCSMPTDATLYYKLGGGSEEEYPGTPVPFTVGQLPVEVTAVARHGDYNDSEPETLLLTKGEGTPSSPYLIYSAEDFSDFVTNVNNGTTFSAYYKLCIDVSASGISAITTDFSGSFDGDSHIITGLTHPLFKTVNGGVVKNVTLKEVNINSSDANVGAIAGVAKGYSRIYNCGILPNSADFPDGTGLHPSVNTSGACAGGLVGSLEDDSRVINCYSYADVSASTTASGIVGKNGYASTAVETDGKYTALRTAVVNCMFYGDIKGGTNQYGVYGGKLIANNASTGINNYNYFRNGSKFTAANGHKNTSSGSNVVGNPTAYYCSFPADERYLTQVEFHRSLLNSNRELCGWWVGSDVAPSTLTTTEVQAIPKDASLMYKWVVDRSLAPYPILKPFGKYASVINNPGNQTGNTLSVTVKSGSGSSAADKTLYIPITNMDPQNHDYGYYKVQLPYFNTVFGNPNGADWAAKYAGNYTDQVVTGWKVTYVNHEGENHFKAAWEDGYNFADRKCTDKDLYIKSGRVFAQGGYYYVPDGVTAITIEAYWGKAIYVRNADASYDRVNITLGVKDAPNNYFGNGSHFAPAGTRDNNVNGATIQTASTKGSIRDALTEANIDAKKTVYDYALVLVGNIQEAVGKNDVVLAADATRGFTIMSIDLDFDEEPDYCLEWQLGQAMGRQEIAPIRFDFLPVVELGIAGKRHNSTNFFSLGCYRSKGHFEVTETAFIHFGQFEFELGTRDEGPVILNGGIYDQYCRGRNGETNQHINYVILGGHIIMPSFTPGAHVNKDHPYQTRHCAVNALGGDFDSFYLTGGYNEGVEPFEDNPHCYIDGGHFGTIAAAYKEGISGDVTWRINHAQIDEFYGGGVMSKKDGTTYKIVKGSIDVVIDNSTVGKYCGGPKFGDMVSGKTVTTSATNTVFSQYFGAGNGGTTYIQYGTTDDSTKGPYDAATWTSTVSGGNPPNYTPRKYKSKDEGYEAKYDMEIINTSTGDIENRVINRSYYYSAQFATTNTGTVTNTLTGCTIEQNFYGAGFLGGVSGNVTSTLTDTRVLGSVFGAGYSASAGTVDINNIDKTPPSANVYTGMIKPQSGGTSTTYYWTHETSLGGNTLSTSSPVALNVDGKNYFFTEIPLTNLGAVDGDVTLTLDGSTKVECKFFNEDGSIDNTKKGGVYGGGQASAVKGTHKVTVNLKGTTQVNGNVYGGGDQGTVEGSTEVNIIQDPPSSGDSGNSGNSGDSEP